MSKNRIAPPIRFQRFTEPWEQRKIGDYYDFKNGLNKGKEYFGAGTPIVNFTDVFNNRGITSEMLKGKVNLTSDEIQNYEVKKGDIFFTRTSETIEEIGYPTVILDSPQNTVFSGFVLRGRCFVDEDPLNNLFKKYVFFTKAFRNEMRCKSSMTTRALTSGKLIKNMEFLFPKNKVEQRKIALFLTNIDNLITLHQRKLGQQKKLKKYFLQNMFPAEGEKMPKIRFLGFTGDWEQYKLDDIYGTIRNAFVGIASPYYVDEGHFYLESNNVKDGSINKNTRVYINDKFYYSQQDKWLHTGDIVMVQSGHVGHSAVIPKSLNNTAAHALIMFQNQKIETDPYFLNAEYQTDRAKKQIYNIAKGNTIKHILASDMKKYIVMVPSLSEQKKISTCFQNIDSLITLHQRKIDQLQAMKKFMLQNLFV